MSQANYRGVAYDTEARKAVPTEKKTVQEIYRGVRHTETVKVAK